MRNQLLKIAVYSVLYLITIAIIASSIVLTPHPIDSAAFSVARTIIVCFATILLGKYTVYMFLCPFYGVISAREKDLVNHFVGDYHPLVSVLIPAWNEEVGLLSTIKTLLDSSYKRLELVVVNDGSTDGSDAMMRRFIAKYNREMAGLPVEECIRILYCYQQNGGKGSALNTAINIAHGEILLSIDADCAVDPGCVQAFVDAFKDPRVMAAVGNVKIANTKTLLGVVQALEFLFGFWQKKAEALLGKTGSIYIIGGAAGAFRREVFEKLGGYSTGTLTEDIEMSLRVQDAGWRIAYAPDAIVYTEGASTLAGLQKQRNRWSRGRLQCFIEMRHMFFSCKKHHNKILCWVVLPLALFSGVQLTLEPLFITTLFVFSCVSSDFSGFISSIAIVVLMFMLQAYDARHDGGLQYMPLAGIGWLLFYLVSFVELRALLQSLWMMMRKKEMKWQKWTRTGVSN